MTDETVTIIATGDIILDEPEPDSFFEHVGDLTRNADLVIGHVEVPHTDRGVPLTHRAISPPADPANLVALKNAGFHVITLAANHAFDQGEPGIVDTIETLKGHGMQVAGTGLNITEARKPAVIEKKGIRFGVLSYNCVGPKDSFATADRAGCAYVENLPEPVNGSLLDAESLQWMRDDIAALKPQVDVVIVALHKGIVHTPAKVLDYEKEVAHAAVDAGANLVISHHAHILRGIEMYKGVPIYHGLNNFVVVTDALSPKTGYGDLNAEYARQRLERFGFLPDPEMPLYPFHPEALQTMVAKVTVSKDGVVSASYLPMIVNKDYKPEVLKNDERGREVADYVTKISKEAGLSASFSWQGDEVLIGA
jgi:poly-gamma-glutamate synthesis protein (capsule biosynthesis protein)